KSELFSFFFQAEDGIRDGHVTGVQTCALPIYAVKAKRGLPLNPQLCEHTAGAIATEYLRQSQRGEGETIRGRNTTFDNENGQFPDRKSTRLNSSHVAISYAVFCLKKKIRKRQK